MTGIFTAKKCLEAFGAISSILFFLQSIALVQSYDWIHENPINLWRLTPVEWICHDEFLIVADLKKIVNSLNSNDKPEVERYIKHFQETTAKLIPGLPENPLEDFELYADAVRNVTQNPIGIFQMTQRVNFHIQHLQVHLDEQSSMAIRLAYLITHNPRHELDVSFDFLISICQWMYHDPEELARGNILGHHTNVELRATDCIDLGVRALEKEYYSAAKGFFIVALRNQHDVPAYRTKRLEESIKLCEELEPDGIRAPRSPPAKFREGLRKFAVGQNREQLVKLCKHDNIQKSDINSSTYCWLETKVHPYWRINPLHVELIALDPDLVQIHNFLGPKVIQELRYDFGELIHDRYDKRTKTNLQRYKRVVYMKARDKNLTAAQILAKKLEFMTGLNSTSTGGTASIIHSPGFLSDVYSTYRTDKLADFVASDDFVAEANIVLEGPEVGGEFMFLDAGVGGHPEVGSVFFWYSLKRDGSPDFLTWHGYCPNLLGRSWYAYKLFTYTDNFLNKPCGLKFMDRYKIFPLPKKIKSKTR